MTGITLDSSVEGCMTLKGQASALDVQGDLPDTYLFDHVQKSDHECTHRLRELSLHVGNIAKVPLGLNRKARFHGQSEGAEKCKTNSAASKKPSATGHFERHSKCPVAA